jgi:hypothetical protein
MTIQASRPWDSQPDEVYQLKFNLLDVEPPIWRS